MAKYLPDDAPITPGYLAETIADLIDDVAAKVAEWYGDQISSLREQLDAIEGQLESVLQAD